MTEVDDMLAWAQAHPSAFDAVAVHMGYFDQQDLEERTVQQRITESDEDAQWLASREQWGDDPAQPRRYPDLPLDHPKNDPRKKVCPSCGAEVP